MCLLDSDTFPGLKVENWIDSPRGTGVCQRQGEFILPDIRRKQKCHALYRSKRSLVAFEKLSTGWFPARNWS